MALKKLLTSASIAAIIASPLAAQTATSTGNQRVGEAPENVVQSTDDTTINAEDSGVGTDEMGNERVGEFQADAEASSAGDSPFSIETVDSAALDSSMKTEDSPWVGKEVTTVDGTPLGTIDGVYTHAGMDYAEVTLDPQMGADTESFLVGINADAGEMDGIQLPQTKAEFVAELKKKVGIKPGAETNG